MHGLWQYRYTAVIIPNSLHGLVYEYDYRYPTVYIKNTTMFFTIFEVGLPYKVHEYQNLGIYCQICLHTLGICHYEVYFENVCKVVI